MSNNELILFGNTQFAVLIKNHIEKYSDFKVAAFAVETRYIKSPRMANIPVVAYETLEDRYSPGDYSFLVAIGYYEMNALRERIINDAVRRGYRLVNFIHPTALIEGEIYGVGNIILENVMVSFGAKIGNGNILWNGVNISHDAVIGNNNYLAPGTILGGGANVVNNCFLGHGCIIREHITLASRTLVGAGCYVNRSTGEDDVWVPARSVKLDKKSKEISI